MRETGIAGPVFISIGDEEKLNLFLELNPKAPKELFLVDGYEFDAYKSIGFGVIAGNPKNTIRGTKKIKFPKFSFATLRKYLRNVMRLSPMKPGARGRDRFPEGVTRLGGTVAVDGNDIKYVYEDGVPGDYPSPAEVLNSLR